MNINKFQNIKISEIIEDLTPTNSVTIDVDGNLFKSPVGTQAQGRIIDGGSAVTTYLGHQNLEGGSAISITNLNLKIDGGAA